MDTLPMILSSNLYPLEAAYISASFFIASPLAALLPTSNLALE